MKKFFYIFAVVLVLGAVSCASNVTRGDQGAYSFQQTVTPKCPPVPNETNIPTSVYFGAPTASITSDYEGTIPYTITSMTGVLNEATVTDNSDGTYTASFEINVTPPNSPLYEKYQGFLVKGSITFITNCSASPSTSGFAQESFSSSATHGSVSFTATSESSPYCSQGVTANFNSPDGKPFSLSSGGSREAVAGTYDETPSFSKVPEGCSFVSVGSGWNPSNTINPYINTLSINYTAKFAPSLVCSPPNQTIKVNSPANFTASGGTGDYTWSGDGSPSSGSGGSFTTSYGTSGPKTVTLKDTADQSTTCSVTVTSPLTCELSLDYPTTLFHNFYNLVWNTDPGASVAIDNFNGGVFNGNGSGSNSFQAPAPSGGSSASYGPITCKSGDGSVTQTGSPVKEDFYTDVLNVDAHLRQGSCNGPAGPMGTAASGVSITYSQSGGGTYTVPVGAGVAQPWGMVPFTITPISATASKGYTFCGLSGPVTYSNAHNLETGTIYAEFAGNGPSCSASFNPSVVNPAGGHSTFSWTAYNASADGASYRCVDSSGVETGSGSAAIDPSSGQGSVGLTVNKSETCTLTIHGINDYSNVTNDCAGSVNVPPEAPTLSGSALCSGTDSSIVNLSWNGVKDVDHYNVYENSSLIGQTSDTTYKVSDLKPNSSYQFYVGAVNSAGETKSNTVVVKTPSCSEITASCSVSPPSISPGQGATLTWASSGATKCDGGGFSTNGLTSGSAPVNPPATQDYTVTCSDSSGNSSIGSCTLQVTSPGGGFSCSLSASGNQPTTITNTITGGSGSYLCAYNYLPGGGKYSGNLPCSSGDTQSYDFGGATTTVNSIVQYASDSSQYTSCSVLVPGTESTTTPPGPPPRCGGGTMGYGTIDFNFMVKNSKGGYDQYPAESLTGLSFTVALRDFGGNYNTYSVTKGSMKAPTPGRPPAGLTFLSWNSPSNYSFDRVEYFGANGRQSPSEVGIPIESGGVCSGGSMNIYLNKTASLVVVESEIADPNHLDSSGSPILEYPKFLSTGTGPSSGLMYSACDATLTSPEFVPSDGEVDLTTPSGDLAALADGQYVLGTSLPYGQYTVTGTKAASGYKTNNDSCFSGRFVSISDVDNPSSLDRDFIPGISGYRIFDQMGKELLDSQNKTSTSFTINKGDPDILIYKYLVPSSDLCSISASPTAILNGAFSTLSWSCVKPAGKICSIDNSIGSVDPTGGSVRVSPKINTTYTLSCSNVDQSQTTVYVGFLPILREIIPR